MTDILRNDNIRDINFLNCDMHTHTGFSDDCDIPADDMLEAAFKSGLQTIAVTDHYDPGYPDPDFPFFPDFKAYHEALTKYKTQYAGRMEILAGLEVGIMEGQFDAAEKAVDDFDYDFIIGSFHCLRQLELHTFDFNSISKQAFIEDFYTYVYECLKTYKNYDILGHLSLPDRYLGEICDYSNVTDVIDAILKLAVYDGKGLEINTSSFRYGTDIWLPRGSILKRYLELGGEILTFGSDAHSPEYYRFHFSDAVEFARSLGFRYCSIFRQRKPEFCKL